MEKNGVFSFVVVRLKILRNRINVNSQNQEALENKLKPDFSFLIQLLMDFLLTWCHGY